MSGNVSPPLLLLPLPVLPPPRTKNARHLDRSHSQSHREWRSGETPVFHLCLCCCRCRCRCLCCCLCRCRCRCLCCCLCRCLCCCLCRAVAVPLAVVAVVAAAFVIAQGFSPANKAPRQRRHRSAEGRSAARRAKRPKYRPCLCLSLPSPVIHRRPTLLALNSWPT